MERDRRNPRHSRDPRSPWHPRHLRYGSTTSWPTSQIAPTALNWSPSSPPSPSLASPTWPTIGDRPGRGVYAGHRAYSAYGDYSPYGGYTPYGGYKPCEVYTPQGDDGARWSYWPFALFGSGGDSPKRLVRAASSASSVRSTGSAGGSTPQGGSTRSADSTRSTIPTRSVHAARAGRTSRAKNAVRTRRAQRVRYFVFQPEDLAPRLAEVALRQFVQSLFAREPLAGHTFERSVPGSSPTAVGPLAHGPLESGSRAGDAPGHDVFGNGAHAGEAM